MNTFHLALSWSVSKGRDTYGYNICRLDVPYNREGFNHFLSKRYRAMGGGYDMTGTVVGDWLQERYQDRLMSIRERAGSQAVGAVHTNRNIRDAGILYGMTSYSKGTQGRDNYVSLDGACGIESIRTIAESIGVKLYETVDRKGHTTGFTVTDYGSLEALRAAGEYVSLANQKVQS